VRCPVWQFRYCLQPTAISAAVPTANMVGDGPSGNRLFGVQRQPSNLRTENQHFVPANHRFTGPHWLKNRLAGLRHDADVDITTHPLCTNISGVAFHSLCYALGNTKKT
jgi:hypothetical protein